MRPVPSRTMLRRSSRDLRLPISNSDGKLGGAPFRSSPWQPPQLFLYSDLVSCVTKRRIHGCSLELTYSNPLLGSNAAPPHSPPPSKPGKNNVPRKLGGVNIPFESTLRNFSNTAACALGVRLVIMSSVNVCRVNGGGFTGYGCTGESFSPSTGDAGTLRYFTGNSGFPLP